MVSSTSSDTTLQGKLAARIEDQLELLLERVQGLLEAGWKRVRVITDHGWLLVPGGMPKVQLPKYLTESRWSRCASIKDSVSSRCAGCWLVVESSGTIRMRPGCPLLRGRTGVRPRRG